MLDRFHSRYTKEQLIDALKEFYKIYNKIPSSNDFRNRIPNMGTFFNHFGNWKNALSAAGLFKNKIRASVYTDQELIDLLIRYYKDMRKIPTVRNIKEKDYMPNSRSFYYHFGSFENALVQANLRHLRKDNHQFGRVEYSKKELLEKLQLYIIKLNRFPTANELDSKFNMPTWSTYNKYFGGLIEAFKELGYNMEEYYNNINIKFEEEMINEFINLTDIIGKTPNSRDLDKYSKQGLCHASKTYTEHFGSMRKIYKLIGLNNIIPDTKKTRKENFKPGRYKDNNELINDLQILAKELDKTPLANDIILYDNLASAGTYIIKFGSWNTALKQAGLKPNTKVRITKNGTKCYSSYEYKLACILEKLNILFIKNTSYKKAISTYNGNKRFDFIISVDNKIIFIEIFGMVNNDLYEEGKTEKLQLCKENNIPLITFYPEDFWGIRNQDIINNLYSQIDNFKFLDNQNIFSFLFDSTKVDSPKINTKQI